MVSVMLCDIQAAKTAPFLSVMKNGQLEQKETPRGAQPPPQGSRFKTYFVSLLTCP